MCFYTFFMLTSLIYTECFAQSIRASDINFRIEPGSQICFYETGKTGQMMEVYYQVLDGQHGDLDINFELTDPNGVKLTKDYKSSENSILMNLKVDGDYTFCLDNSYSLMNSKLVFLYILVEDKNKVSDGEAEVAVVDKNGNEQKEVLEWGGVDEDGKMYYLEVGRIADSLSLTLGHVVKSRHLLDVYAATKSRDSYLAFEGTFVVDVWSGFQISLMFLVGILQVFMIKKLFNSTNTGYKSMY